MLTYRPEDLEKQTARDVLHQVQCDLEYFLQETDSRGGQLPKHALDMMLKRTVCEIQQAGRIPGGYFIHIGQKQQSH